MPKHRADITQIDIGIYRVFSPYCKDSINITAQDLLDIYIYVERHKQAIKREALDKYTAEAVQREHKTQEEPEL